MCPIAARDRKKTELRLVSSRACQAASEWLVI